MISTVEARFRAGYNQSALSQRVAIMTTNTHIRFAKADEADTIAHLVVAMEQELWPESEIDEDAFVQGAESLLGTSDRHFWAMVAENDNREIVGVLTLNECAAIYAAGKFGEIMEIYILPELRSEGIGAQLIAQAKSFGRERGWPCLEVGAPAPLKWQQTYDFYIREGFREIGPRLELLLD